MATKEDVPKYDELMKPTLRALQRLGGSASIHELLDEIVSDLNISDEIAEVVPENSTQPVLESRAAWARSYLKKVGLVDNSERAVWALTPAGLSTEPSKVDPRKVVREVHRLHREKKRTLEEEEADTEDPTDGWREELLEILLEMDPTAFERLCQRLLRESGFFEVEVTRRSGDGGIDGHGTMRIGGLISFNVLFQSKRYQTNVGPDVVREFRGAMTGRADKGLIITTGGFTREARREATRDGAPPIDLIDGELLADKLKELGLGVTTRMVEEVGVKRKWFESI